MVARADSELIRLALQHLLGNAWKFTAKTATPQIEFGRFMAADAKGTAPSLRQAIPSRAANEPVFFVKDNGLGFDENQIEKLFCPFARLHGDPACEGLGMGLAIVRRIVHRHGGWIGAEGRPGNGALFFFILGVSGQGG